MESVAVCALQNEPSLLVGKTGCRKTTLRQGLENLIGRWLLVLRLYPQMDSTNLLASPGVRRMLSFSSTFQLQAWEPSQEVVTFKAFRDREMHMSATHDWLDLGINHMSKW